MSKSSASVEADGNSPTTSSPPGEVAFLVHSVTTWTEKLPPDVDNKSLVRQKKRRTSPEDQKVLEDAFKSNPRPDKKTRRDIVSRVSLGDKAVQIWFQNRRQHQRRKLRKEGHDIPSSDPIDESDLASPDLSGSDPSEIASDDIDPQENEGDENDVFSTNAEPIPRSTSPTPALQDDSQVKPMSSMMHTFKSFSSQSENQSPAPSSSQGSPDMSSQQSNKSGYLANRNAAADVALGITDSQSSAISMPHVSQARLSSQPPTTGYLANRRSMTANPETAYRRPLPAAPSMNRNQPPRTLNRSSSSSIRLSMTEDGKAKVVDRAVQSPSPERPVATVVEAAMVSRLGSLRRSYSAAGLDNAPNVGDARDSVRKFPRTAASGRSRDSRTWEFWCDSDARNSLIERADQESSGSAVEAIGLMRSNSNRALRMNANKMNSPLVGQTRSKGHAKDSRAPLRRSSTHAGFMQPKPVKAKPERPKKASKKGGETEEYEQLNTESDKENWEPSPQRTQPSSFIRTTKKVLGENTTVMSQSSSLGAMMARDKSKPQSRPATIYVDKEVASFMASSSQPSNGDDLDCVQSLLSLSQGNWN